MKTKCRIRKQVSTKYINLCFECEIPVKEAIKYGFTLQNLKQQVLLNNESLLQSINANYV
jgi:hypothetical protein